MPLIDEGTPIGHPGEPPEEDPALGLLQPPQVWRDRWEAEARRPLQPTDVGYVPPPPGQTEPTETAHTTLVGDAPRPDPPDFHAMLRENQQRAQARAQEALAQEALDQRIFPPAGTVGGQQLGWQPPVEDHRDPPSLDDLQVHADVPGTAAVRFLPGDGPPVPIVPESLLDYFATAAMPTMLDLLAVRGQGVQNVAAAVARASYDQAEAMLNERSLRIQHRRAMARRLQRVARHDEDPQVQAARDQRFRGIHEILAEANRTDYDHPNPPTDDQLVDDSSVQF